MYTPANYNRINLAAGTYSPSTAKAKKNKSFKFWERSLFERVWSRIDITTPAEWSPERINLMKYCILHFGYVMIADESKYGIIAQPATLSGIGFDYQFTTAIVSNPKLHTPEGSSKEYTIGENCEIIRLTPFYEGIGDIVDYYAAKLSALDISVDTAIQNSKLAWLLGAKNKSSAQALKKILDLVNKGESAVVYDKTIEDDAQSKEMPFQFLPIGDVKNNYILTNLLQDFATILNDFDNEIGIATVPYTKAERLVTAEAESKNEDSQARLTVWLESLNESMQAVNELFNTNFSASAHINEGGSDNGNGENNNNRI